MKCRMVKGRYSGDQESYISGLADAGCGYLILERGKDRKGAYCLAAFHYIEDGEPMPEHLEEVYSKEADKLELRFCKRSMAHKPTQEQVQGMMLKRACPICGLID